MLAVLGLGNPGEEYAPTRHNVGFRILDAVAGDAGSDFGRRRFDSLVAEVRLGDEKVLLCKPQTFMNLSGRAARSVLDFYKLELPEMLVVCDDYSLDLGRLRVRRGGSSGGHNGLESVREQLGSTEFPRLRVGIGAARGDSVKYVLGRFGKEEEEVIAGAVRRAAEAVRCWAVEGIGSCMNGFNAAPAGEGDGASDRSSEEAS
ncbi:MAG: aminoacyl-tRNA hydrolase [Planctomycetota bacterium]|jgi:PTH1 family peptidyl-tRNA hydrolase